MSEISYAEYYNPHPLEPEPALIDQILDHDPYFTMGYRYPRSLSQYLLDNLPRRKDWPVGVAIWHKTAKEWVPESAIDWWMAQFEANDGLDSMPRTWWLTQSHSIVAARDEDRLVGMVALNPVRWPSRMLNPRENTMAFAEIRGLVVNPAYRRSNARIGRHLVQQIVGISQSMLTSNNKTVPTIALTTNPVAARIFEATGAVQDPVGKGLGITKMALKRLACWQLLESYDDAEATQKFCNECPIYSTQVWIWPSKSAVK